MRFQHLENPSLPLPSTCSLDVYFWRSRELLQKLHPDLLEKYRHLDWNTLTEEYFLSEYIQCVYTSGFNSKTISDKIKTIIKVFESGEDTEERVLSIIKNKSKYKAVRKTQEILKNLGWNSFKNTYLLSPKTMENLPFIGPVTSQPLARSLGLDTVSPDLHLVQLSEHYKFSDVFAMRKYLSQEYGEKSIVVDFILSYFKTPAFS